MKFYNTLFIVAFIGVASADWPEQPNQPFDQMANQNGMQILDSDSYRLMNGGQNIPGQNMPGQMDSRINGLSNNLREIRNDPGLKGIETEMGHGFRNDLGNRFEQTGMKFSISGFDNTLSALENLAKAMKTDVSNAGQRISELNLSGQVAKQATDFMNSISNIADKLSTTVQNRDLNGAINAASQMGGVLPQILNGYTSLVDAKVRMSVLLKDTIGAIMSVGKSIGTDVASFLNPLNLMRTVSYAMTRLPTSGITTLMSTFNPLSYLSGITGGQAGYSGFQSGSGYSNTPLSLQGFSQASSVGLNGVLDSTGRAVNGLLGARSRSRENLGRSMSGNNPQNGYAGQQDVNSYGSESISLQNFAQNPTSGYNGLLGARSRSRDDLVRRMDTLRI